MKQDVVESGAFLNTLLNLFSTMWDKSDLDEYVAKSRKPKQQEIVIQDEKTGENYVTGLFTTWYLSNRHKMKTKQVFEKPMKELDKDKIFPCELYVAMDTGEKYKFEGAQAPKNAKQLGQKLEDCLGDAYPDDFTAHSISEEAANEQLENTESSTKLQIKASKDIKTGEYILHKVYANYEPIQALDDLEEVFQDLEETNDFSIEEDPTCLEIVPYEDEYEITEISDVQTMTTCVSEILLAQYEIMFAIEDSHYFDTYSSDFYELGDYILGLLLTENNIILTLKWPPEQSYKGIDILSRVDIIKLREDTSTLCERVERYACMLDLYRANFDTAIQSLIDEWLLALRYTF